MALAISWRKVFPVLEFVHDEPSLAFTNWREKVYHPIYHNLYQISDQFELFIRTENKVQTESISDHTRIRPLIFDTLSSRNTLLLPSFWLKCLYGLRFFKQKFDLRRENTITLIRWWQIIIISAAGESPSLPSFPELYSHGQPGNRSTLAAWHNRFGFYLLLGFRGPEISVDRFENLLFGSVFCDAEHIFFHEF